MKYSSRYILLVLFALVLFAAGCSYDGSLPPDDGYIADGPAQIRENFRALKDDAIVNAGTVAGLSVGNASGNIPRSNGTLNTNLNSDLLDGYHASAFNASDALLLRLDGSRAMTGNLKFSGNYGVLQSTSDAADTGYTFLAGGGALSTDRGAYIAVQGNEHAQTGQVVYRAGNVTGGDHVFYVASGTERLRIGYDGLLTAKGDFVLSGGRTVHTGTSDGSDSSYAYLCGGGAAGDSRGAYIILNGNENVSTGILKLYAGNVSGGHIIFRTGGADRGQVSYGGNWLVGTISDDGVNKLQVSGSAYFSGNTILPNNVGYQSKNTSGTARAIAYIDSSDITRLGTTSHATKINSNGTLTHNGYTIWDSNSDGSGSGLDADTLDGSSSAAFATAAQGTKADNALPSSSYTAADVLTKIKTVDGLGSGLDADKLDGYALSTSASPNTVVLRNSTGGIIGTTVVGTTIIDSALAGTGNRLVYSDSDGLLTNSSSDARMKRSVSTIGGALGKVLSLRGVYYNWNAKEAKKLGNQREMGMIAQEVEKVIPEVVGTNGTGMKSIDYPKLVAVLVEAIKELHAKVQRRTSDNAALLRKIEKQEREINELREEMRVMRSLFEDAVGDKADYDRMDGQHLGAYIQTN